MTWYSENGDLVYCENGNLAETDECPCGCPDFDGRVIAYVDKHATGANDGTSLLDAYTDIQTAIDNDPKKEIQIQGYGEFDTYQDGIILAECIYLKGVDDVWIDSSFPTFAITGNAETRVDFINVNGGTGFLLIVNVNNCIIKNASGGSTSTGVFNQCTNIDLCTSLNSGTSGFSSFTNATSCNATNSDGHGFLFNNANVTSCNSLNNNGVGFVGDDSILLECVSDGNGLNGSSGFFCSNSTLTTCEAKNNWRCGFKKNPLANIYNLCIDTNNCLSGELSCTPSDPSYVCDTV